MGEVELGLRSTLRALRVGEDLRRLGGLARRALAPDDGSSWPQGPPGAPSGQLDSLLRSDDRRLDLALGAALIAQEDAPELELGRVTDEVEALACALRARLAAGPPRDAAARLAAANAFFFEDLGFGPTSSRGARQDERLADLMLPAVLRRRRGQCVGLSLAYLAIGTRAGLPVFGVSAPGHFFVRWDGEGLRQNVETTARGAATDDEHYIERYGIRRLLVDRGVYLQSLRRREVLVEVLNNRANAFWDRGDVARAARDLDRILRVSNAFARAHLGRGFLALQRGELEVAQRELDRALEIDPDLSRAHLLLGEVHLRTGRLEAAESAFERAIEHDATNALALTNLGRVHARRGELDRAVENHERALAADRRCHVAWNNLGVARRAMGEVEQARAAFRRAAALAPEFLPARENLVLLGRQGDRIGWLARPGYLAVRRAYERRLERAPQDDEARAGYVHFLLEAGLEPDRAASIARTGARVHRSARTLEALALALRRQGNLGGAASAVEEAVAIDRERDGLEVERLERLLDELRAGLSPP